MSGCNEQLLNQFIGILWNKYITHAYICKSVAEPAPSNLYPLFAAQRNAETQVFISYSLSVLGVNIQQVNQKTKDNLIATRKTPFTLNKFYNLDFFGPTYTFMQTKLM